MSQETRRFTMHPHLLLDVMRRQAGTLPKAIAEGVMNSVDAGSTFCDVTLNATTLTINDDGKGFRNREEIETWFEKFGTPHEASEGKTYGTFRMGRGQIFSFGKNVWQTGEFKMIVDVATKGLDYDLSCGNPLAKGCSIDVTLYKQLLPSEIINMSRDIEKMMKYVPLTLRLNGNVISAKPEDEKWDYVTDEAYIRIRGTTALSVYNLGVWVRDFNNYQFGCGGVVVSRKQLVLNFARNDIMVADCSNWRKIRKLVDQKATERNKRKPTLDDGERQRLAEQVASGEISPKEAMHLKLFTDVSGRHISADQLARNRSGKSLTVAPRGDILGDKLHQSGVYFVLAEETLERFSVNSLKCLVSTIKENCGIGWWNPKLIAFKDATKGMNSKYVIIEPEQWKTREKAWVDLIKSSQKTMLWFMTVHDGVNRSPRKIVVGDSENALAWTDGSNYVAYSRNFLRYLQFNMQGAMELADIALHEQCHDGEDACSHIHSPDFYQQFHDCRKGSIEMACDMFKNMPAVLEFHGQRLNEWILKQQDTIVKIDKAKQKHPVMSGYAVAACANPHEPPTTPSDPTKVAARCTPPAPSADEPKKAVDSDGNPYKTGSSYGVLFLLASQKAWKRDELLAEAARMTGKPVDSLAMSLQVLMNPNHKSNNGKSHAVKENGMVRLVGKE